jgi:radical SAM superfamily enzyme YgiQ (UPF0313 family)
MFNSELNPYPFETGVYRPPSEGGSASLLVRLTRNCPWNHCTFCGMYKQEKFALRSVDEIKADIDAMAALCRDLRSLSVKLGYGGEVCQAAALALIDQKPALNDHQGVAMLYHWLLSGARTAFLQDANSLIMKTNDLVEVLRHSRTTFPSLQRVTSYARSKTLMQKSDEDLAAIRAAGLDRLHVGLESGDDEVLKSVKKGVSGDVHIKGGRKALAAGFQLSEYWMPGLGGKSRWEQHARNTARVLNAIDPHYIRSRPFHPLPGTPLWTDVENAAFELLSPREQLLELKLMMEEVDLNSRVCFDHAGNYWKNRQGGYLFSQSYEGYKFPEQKQEVLALIEEGLQAANRRPRFTRL